MPVIYTAGIIRRGNRFLCMYHSKLQRWLFAGGKPENGETTSTCIIRELREELGIEVFDLELYGCYLTNVQGKEFIGIFYTIHGFDGEPINMEPHTCIDLQWLTVAEMQERSACYPEMGIAEALKHGINHKTKHEA